MFLVQLRERVQIFEGLAVIRGLFQRRMTDWTELCDRLNLRKVLDEVVFIEMTSLKIASVVIPLVSLASSLP